MWPEITPTQMRHKNETHNEGENSIESPHFLRFEHRIIGQPTWVMNVWM